MIDLIFSDDDIEMTEQEASALDIIMASDCKDIVGLIASAGYDTKTFFEAGDWEGVDFRGCRVDGVSFRGANMSRAKLYRDQLATVRKTKPKSLHKAQVYVGREAAETCEFSIILDRPLNPAEARADFKYALESVVSHYLNVKKVDWNTLVPYVPALDVPLGRLWALQLVLDELPNSFPTAALLERFASGFSADAKTAVGETVLANKLIAICRLDDVDDRLEVLKAQSQTGSDIDWRLQRKLPEIVRDLDELERVVIAFIENAWPIKRALFFTTVKGLKLRSTDIARLLSLMEKAKVTPDTAVFSNLAERTKSMEDIDPFLALMEKAKVTPDTAVFSNLAQRTKSMEDIDPFLALMEKAKVTPDTAVFSNLAERTKSMEDIDPFLALMEKAKVTPDTAVFNNLAERTKSMEDIVELRRLLKQYDLFETVAVLRSFVGACVSVEEAEEFFALLDQQNAKPTAHNLNKLLSNVDIGYEAKAAWEVFDRFSVRRDRVTLNTFIKKQETWESSWNVFSERWPPEVVPDSYTFSHLLSKAHSRRHVKQVFGELHRVRLDAGQLHALLQSPCSDEDVLWGFDQFRKRGLDPKAVEPDRFGDQAERFSLLLSKFE